MCVQQSQRKERGMTLIHMVLIDGELEGLKHAHAANAEHGFLLQPIDLVTAVSSAMKRNEI
jgi:hypothetical protein